MFIRFLRPLARAGFAVALVAVATASLLPSAMMPNFGLSDKLGHFLAYSALMLAGTIALKEKAGAMPGRVLLLAGGLIAYGLGLEAAQALSPGRMPSALDGVADTAGIILGLAAAIGIRRWMRTPRASSIEDTAAPGAD